MSTLRLYAGRVNRIVEAGVQRGISTWALLQGLHDAVLQSGVARKVFRAYDIVRFPDYLTARRLATSLGIDYKFKRANFIFANLEETDLLFIDTFHGYPQLRSELRRHAGSTRRYLILHDTSLNGDVSECVGSEIIDCADFFPGIGFSPVEIRVGLWPAVEEFLAGHPEWRLVRRYTHNNGLTVLERQPSTDTLTYQGPGGRNRRLEAWRPCALNLTSSARDGDAGRFAGRERRGTSLQAARALALVALARAPSAWAHVRLGILLLDVFGEPVFPAGVDRRDLEQPTYWMHRAELLAPSNNASRLAQLHFAAALRLDPLQAQALLATAHSLCPRWRHLECGGPNTEGAVTLLGTAARAHHTAWEARLMLGALLAGRGALAEAVSALRAAVELRPGSPHTVDMLREALRRAGGRSEAMATYATVDESEADPLPMTSAYWDQVLCRASVGGSHLHPTTWLPT